MKIIAHIDTDLPDKFGVPRQSNLAPNLKGRIVFEPEYRDANALKGLDGYDYLWVLWEFEGVEQEEFRPMVRPPRLGGNEYVGVFATRSPFRPSPIGLSSVKIDAIRITKEEGPIIEISGIDMRNGTPVYDIKPYLPYVDAHPDAREGFTRTAKAYRLAVDFPSALLEQIPTEKRSGLSELLEQDPRPSYQKDPKRVYGISYAGYNLHFRVDDQGLHVLDLEKAQDNPHR